MAQAAPAFVGGDTFAEWRGPPLGQALAAAENAEQGAYGRPGTVGVVRAVDGRAQRVAEVATVEPAKHLEANVDGRVLRDVMWGGSQHPPSRLVPVDALTMCRARCSHGPCRGAVGRDIAQADIEQLLRVALHE